MRTILKPQWKWRLLRRTRGGSEAARALGVTVGSGCRIISCNVRSEYWLVAIGDRVTVSSDVTFVTHDGTGWLVRDDDGERYYRYARIQVGNDVFIGAKSLIMPGVRIGDRCIVAAGSVVTKSVPTGSVVGGSPARVLGSFDDFETRVRDEWVKGSDRRGKDYRSQVESVVDREFRPEM